MGYSSYFVQKNSSKIAKKVKNFKIGRKFDIFVWYWKRRTKTT